MQTKDHKGIVCDLTGMSYRDQFIYYSASISEIVVRTSLRYVYPPKVKIEIDVGEACFNRLLDKAKKHVKSQTRNSIFCDLCPGEMKGDFEYYRLSYDRVDVDLKREEKMQVDSKFTEMRCCSSCFESLDSAIKMIKSKRKHGRWT